MQKVVTTLVPLIVLLFVGCTINKDASELFEAGKKHLENQDTKKAYSDFKKAAKKQPEDATYHWAAAQTAPDQNAAYLHTRDAWQAGAKTRPVLQALSRLAFHTELEDKLEFTLSLYDQLPDSLQTADYKADIYASFEAFDSSLAIRKSLFARQKTPLLCNKISENYVQLKNPEKAIATLQQCLDQGILNARGFSFYASLQALEYNYPEVTKIFQQAQRADAYDDNVRLEHAGFLLAQGKLSEIHPILTPLINADNAEEENIFNLRARVMLVFTYLQSGNLGDISQILKAVDSDSKWDIAERTLYQALQKAQKDTSEFKPQALIDAIDQLPSDPVLTLIKARTFASMGNYKNAIETYRQLPPVFLRSPAMVAEFAKVLAQSGKTDDALMVLSLFHQQKLFTKTSLELFRDLTYQKQLVEKSSAAQKVLESKYSDDVGILWSGAVLALRTGELQKAFNIFTKLGNRFPDDPRFEMAKLSTMVLQKRYEDVLEQLSRSNLDASKTLPIKARALRGLGKDNEAIQTFEKATSSATASVGVLLEYASFLLAENQPSQAAKIYQRVDEKMAQSNYEDSASAALRLNNLAWAQMQSGEYDIHDVVKTAHRAWTLLPTNAHVLDTYTEALIKSNQYDEAIELLQDNKIAENEPRLLFHLATAFEKSGDINRAVRNYQKATGLLSKQFLLPMPVTAQSLEKHIAKLIASSK